MDHPVAVCTSTVSKKRKIVWELESLNLIPIILDEEILVIKVEAYPTFYQTYFYQLTWFWHLGYKISLSVMDALTVMLFLPRCNPLPRIWMMRSGAALAKSALTCMYFSSVHSFLHQPHRLRDVACQLGPRNSHYFGIPIDGAHQCLLLLSILQCQVHGVTPNKWIWVWLHCSWVRQLRFCCCR